MTTHGTHDPRNNPLDNIERAREMAKIDLETILEEGREGFAKVLRSNPDYIAQNPEALARYKKWWTDYNLAVHNPHEFIRRRSAEFEQALGNPEAAAGAHHPAARWAERVETSSDTDPFLNLSPKVRAAITAIAQYTREELINDGEAAGANIQDADAHSRWKHDYDLAMQPGDHFIREEERKIVQQQPDLVRALQKSLGGNAVASAGM